MAKKIVGFIKLQVPAGKANPSPPDWTGSWPTRFEHHGILQGIQCPDADAGGRNAHSGRHYCVR